MPANPPFLQDFLDTCGEASRIYNLTGSSLALLLALQNEPFFAVESNQELSEELCRDINFFREALQKEPALFLPESDGAALSGERSRIIDSLRQSDSIVSSFKNLETPVWSVEEIKRMTIILRKGMEVRREEVEKSLSELGYTVVPLVSDKGEYSHRGWLLDIFPTTSEVPLRIEFFGDEIESLKSFNVDTQRSGDDIPEFLIYPAGKPAARSG